jgi:hypothetical protein
MIIFLVAILSNALGSIGLIYLIKRSKFTKFSSLIKSFKVNTFLVWLIQCNILFYFFFFAQSILYKQIIINSEYTEIISGSAGGYFTTEEIAQNYFRFRGIINWSFLIVNIILFLSGFIFKRKTNTETINKTKPMLIFTISLIIISIVACLTSSILFALLNEFSVSYGG